MDEACYALTPGAGWGFLSGTVHTRLSPWLAGAGSALSAAVVATLSCHVVSSHGSETINKRPKSLSTGHCLRQRSLLAVSRSAPQLFALNCWLGFPQTRFL